MGRRLQSGLAASQPSTKQSLTHFDEAGRAQMVEVGRKPETDRVAIASGFVSMALATAKRIEDGAIAKGDVLAVARLAGISALKRTSELIPLCHPLRITGVKIELVVRTQAPIGVSITATARAFDRTGVEMEALTAVAVAGLTIYDMCKAIDRGMTLASICLEHKHGGKSGVWDRSTREDTIPV